jgi:flagellar biosynthesis/type III secretory pathway protein FliH
MRPGEIGGRAQLRVACLRRIVAARHLEEERRFLLFNFVATYIESDQRISEEYDELLRREDNREVREEMMTWAEKIEAKGYSLGHREGRREGRQEGRREGFQAGRQEGEAALLLRMAERKFGHVSSAARRRIEDARPEQLLAWGERLVTARSLEEALESE